MDKPSVCRIKSAVAGEGMEREGADPFALSDLSLSWSREDERGRSDRAARATAFRRKRRERYRE